MADLSGTPVHPDIHPGSVWFFLEDYLLTRTRARYLSLDIGIQIRQEARRSVGTAFLRKSSAWTLVNEFPGSNPARSSVGLGSGRTVFGFF